MLLEHDHYNCNPVHVQIKLLEKITRLVAVTFWSSINYDDLETNTGIQNNVRVSSMGNFSNWKLKV